MREEARAAVGNAPSASALNAPARSGAVPGSLLHRTSTLSYRPLSRSHACIPDGRTLPHEQLGVRRASLVRTPRAQRLATSFFLANGFIDARLRLGTRMCNALAAFSAPSTRISRRIAAGVREGRDTRPVLSCMPAYIVRFLDDTSSTPPRRYRFPVVLDYVLFAGRRGFRCWCSSRTRTAGLLVGSMANKARRPSGSGRGDGGREEGGRRKEDREGKKQDGVGSCTAQASVGCGASRTRVSLDTAGRLGDGRCVGGVYTRAREVWRGQERKRPPHAYRQSCYSERV
ncbi:hypothetical protein C8R45DRAFT_144890 [Mycena sanguinolenta]|nr:hypothetical protein C8R45DRAFT_144890 [Mycena sanguinolenta]